MFDKLSAIVFVVSLVLAASSEHLPTMLTLLGVAILVFYPAMQYVIELDTPDE